MITITKVSEEYVADGVQTIFDYRFKIFHSDHLIISVDGIGVNAVITGTGNDLGGTIEFAVAPILGSIVFIQRESPAVQETDYKPNEPFKVESHEEALDYNVAIIQELKSRLSSDIVKGDTGAPGTPGAPGVPGVAKYDPEVVYQKDSIVSFDGSIYISVIDNNIGELTDPLKWERFLDEDSITTLELAPNAVQTDNILDNSVLLSKMGHGTPHKLIGFDGSGEPVGNYESPIGVNQNWYNVTSGRNKGVNYQNFSGKSTFNIIYLLSSTDDDIFINDVHVSGSFSDATSTVFIILPHSHFLRVGNGSGSIFSWFELR